MSPLSIRSFTLFREEQPVRDALVLFTLTLLLHFFGAMLRLVQELSFFWPLNAVMAGIFARYIAPRLFPNWRTGLANSFPLPY